LAERCHGPCGHFVGTAFFVMVSCFRWPSGQERMLSKIIQPPASRAATPRGACSMLLTGPQGQITLTLELGCCVNVIVAPRGPGGALPAPRRSRRRALLTLAVRRELLARAALSQRWCVSSAAVAPCPSAAAPVCWRRWRCAADPASARLGVGQFTSGPVPALCGGRPVPGCLCKGAGPAGLLQRCCASPAVKTALRQRSVAAASVVQCSAGVLCQWRQGPPRVGILVAPSFACKCHGAVREKSGARGFAEAGASAAGCGVAFVAVANRTRRFFFSHQKPKKGLKIGTGSGVKMRPWKWGLPHNQQSEVDTKTWVRNSHH